MRIHLPPEVRTIAWNDAGDGVRLVLRYRGFIGLAVWVRDRIRRALGVC